VLSRALASAARDTLGVTPSDAFAMTEVLPVSGRTCNQGHLHLDLNMGLVEVLALDGSGAAGPGELGTLVVTPYFPYRDCMPVFRYDTRDVVRCLADEPLACNLAGSPGVSRILGKAAEVLDTDRARVTPRDIVEVVEALPAHPWPAQYRARVDRGVLDVTVPASALAGTTTASLVGRFDERGIDAAVTVDESGEPLRSVRADLLETTFTTTRPDGEDRPDRSLVGV
jgi:phenylacetate-coenzyme A ligase PaaK-like adenylate-forming protein